MLIQATLEHLQISLIALAFAILIGVSAGYICWKHAHKGTWVLSFFQVLRVVPSLAILLLLLPFIGTGIVPALIALVLLAVPPILMNTTAGLKEVDASLIEASCGLGMTEAETLRKVRFPLALPVLLAGIKTAAIEIIASATLAAKIGAGGLGELIFTGLGLNRIDLIIIGGVSVALLSLTASVLFDFIGRRTIKHTYINKKEGKRPMRPLKQIVAIAATLTLAFSLVACSSPNTSDTTIKIGSKDFTESIVISEVYALALEDAGYTVERVPAIAGSLVHAAITNGEVDIYPEYTGTGLLAILQMEMMTDPEEVYQTVSREYNKQFDITWLDYAAANDGQGLVIRTSVANDLGITTISDVQKHAAELNFASQGEFDEREDGMPALVAAYGPFNWKSSKVYDNGLKYSLLSNGEADVAPAYTTEGQLVNKQEYNLLVDDKQVWPPYNLAPIVRNQVLEAHPSIAETLNKVSAQLDTGTVTTLNAAVDVDKREYDEVAREFYTSIK